MQQANVTITVGGTEVIAWQFDIAARDQDCAATAALLNLVLALLGAAVPDYPPPAPGGHVVDHVHTADGQVHHG